MQRLAGLFLLDRTAHAAVYVPQIVDAIGQRVRLLGPALTQRDAKARPDLLADADVIFSGWGMARADEAFLQMTPNLKAVFYAAGAINGWATAALFDRGVVVTTANDANAIPVAEYTVAMTILALKHGLRLASAVRRPEGSRPRLKLLGNYRATVGIVGMGTIGRLVVDRLRPFGPRVVAFDPYLSDQDAELLGVGRVGLDELFAMSDVVSLHAPDLPTTRGMIDGRLVRSMREGATLINTARGRVLREGELADVLRERDDLHAVLDVTEQEPLDPRSPLLTLPNLTLTPHIAGSQGRECERMGQYMVEELDRYLAGQPLKWRVNPSAAAYTVHQLGPHEPVVPRQITA